MIPFLGKKILLFILVAALFVLLCFAEVVTECIMEYAAIFAGALLVLWVCNTVRVAVLLCSPGSRVRGIAATAFYALPQPFVIRFGYLEMLRVLPKHGEVAAAIDFLLMVAVYAAVSFGWNQLIVKDKVGVFGTVFWTAVHFAFSTFFIGLCL